MEYSAIDIAPLDHALRASRDGPIQDPEIFVETLGTVGSTLNEAGLPDGFNQVYHHLSKRVLGLAQDSPEHGPRFTHPQDVLNTMSIFGDFWFKPLRHYVDHVQGDATALEAITPAWREALDPDLLFATPGLQFLTGMVAHISGRDLPASLYLSGVTARYYPDYTHVVQHLIGQTTRDLARELVPAHRGVRSTLRPPLVAAIGRMREDAWRNSQVLSELPPQRREPFMQALDIRAAKRIGHIKRYGGPLIKVAQVTERLPDWQSGQVL